MRPEERVKLLGVHIDNKLNFGHHVSHICQKAGKQVKVLGRLSRVLTESNKLLLYSSFILCYFNYCCVLCYFCNISDTLKIDKLQEKVLRYSMLDFRSPYQQLLHTVLWKVYFIFTMIAKADGSHLQDTKWIVSVVRKQYYNC